MKPYRGKRIKDSEWVYGWLLGENIIVTDYETDYSKHTGVETQIKESYVVFCETVERNIHNKEHSVFKSVRWGE